MSQDMHAQMKELHRAIVREILTLAEIGLLPAQFRQFKKKVFEIYHDQLGPETQKILRGQKARQYEAQNV